MSSYATRNFEVIENDTLEFTVYLKQSDGSAIDLTGTTVRLDVRTAYTATSVALALSEGDGITVTDLEGKIEIAKTAVLPDADYVYDLQVAFPSRTKTYLRGKLKIVPEVTQ